MARRRLLVCLGCCAAAAAAGGAPAGEVPAATLEAALARNDECLAGESCAVSALQLHGLRKATTPAPSAEVTCDGFPYDPPSEGCCGGKVAYLTKSQGCCNNQAVYSLSDPKACLPTGATHATPAVPAGAKPAAAKPVAPAATAAEPEPLEPPPADVQFNCSKTWPPVKARKAWMLYCQEVVKGKHKAWAMSPDCKAAWYVTDAKSADFAELDAIDKCSKKGEEACAVFDREGALCEVFKPDAQCGEEMYKPGKQGCCDRAAYDLESQACCGGIQVYDKGDEGCCAGVVYHKPDQGCCNRKDIYETSSQACCASHGNSKVCPKKSNHEALPAAAVPSDPGVPSADSP